jgi:hypothetical protein
MAAAREGAALDVATAGAFGDGGVAYEAGEYAGTLSGAGTLSEAEAGGCWAAEATGVVEDGAADGDGAVAGAAGIAGGPGAGPSSWGLSSFDADSFAALALSRSPTPITSGRSFRQHLSLH